LSADEVTLDFDRGVRIGLPEAIFAAGKSTAQLEHILALGEARGQAMLITRLEADRFAVLAEAWRTRLDYCAVSRTAILGDPPSPIGSSIVALVAAGSSDLPVLREAERTLRHQGEVPTVFADVGVAGLWRITSRLEQLRGFPIVVAIAGMDAALPTVLGGLIGASIIAVPTSVGYGVAAGGHAALNAILASCAPGIVVTNIDNGYGGACAALRIARVIRASQNRPDRSAAA
jgi:NCAIR mutase (PurE)-related protein